MYFTRTKKATKRYLLFLCYVCINTKVERKKSDTDSKTVMFARH